MEAIGSPSCALLFGQRRLWVRVDVQASADRKGPRVICARPLSPLLAAEPAYLAGGGSPGFDRHVGSPCGERQPLAGMFVQFNGENAQEKTLRGTRLATPVRRKRKPRRLRWRAIEAATSQSLWIFAACH